MTRVMVLALVSISLACAALGPQSPPWQTPAERLVWPLPPDPPRIEYLGAIHSARDLGGAEGAWRRFVSLLFGAKAESLVNPVSVASNGAGMLVVADPGLPTVHFFDLPARRYAELGGEVAARLGAPVGVAIDEDGRTYVADSLRAKVFVLGPDHELVGELGEGLLERPTGLSLDPQRNRLYVVDTTAARIFAFDLRDGAVTSFGRRGLGPGEFNSPTHVSVAPDGTLTVSDSLNFRVQRFRPDGTPLGGFGRAGDAAGYFTRPKGVATDASGRLFVVDAAFENVQVFAPEGTLLLAFGRAGTGPGEFYLPNGAFFDAGNRLWVADSFNGRVQCFRLLVEPR